MTRPLPRWYRHRCPHENRVEFVAGGRVYRDFCEDCGADFPVDLSTSDTQRAGANPPHSRLI